jgi:divalent metal cation (Fe/Co/Zn/Cd) transporter
MFGYGRAQSAAALVAATLFISFTALRLYEEAIRRCSAPRPPATTTQVSQC